jgi:hypothetical protein
MAITYVNQFALYNKGKKINHTTHLKCGLDGVIHDLKEHPNYVFQENTIKECLQIFLKDLRTINSNEEDAYNIVL